MNNLVVNHLIAILTFVVCDSLSLFCIIRLIIGDEVILWRFAYFIIAIMSAFSAYSIWTLNL